MLYPKIETLFDRDPSTHKVIIGQLRRPEFGLVDQWLVTEKIDGTNIRVEVELGDMIVGMVAAFEGDIIPTEVTFKGRTDRASIPAFLLDKLQEMFPPELFEKAFDEDVGSVILFGEGYGARIQKGGGDYRDGVNFRLFDVVIRGEDERAWWLKWEDVEDVARKLGIQTVPVMAYNATTDQAIGMGQSSWLSVVADAETKNDTTRHPEGIVARTEPALFDRRGARLIWKLKERDF